MKLNLKRKELAINGGQPVRTKAWLDNLTFGEEEKRAVCEVMDSGYLSLFEGSHTPDPPFSFWGGPKVQELEKNWCEYYGVPYAVSMNSATSGLYAAIGALGLGYGDEVIVSPYTMSACAACTLMYGAIPVFADVQLETGCLAPESIEEHISERTKAILVVHQFGFPADMKRILELADKFNLKVIEDCAQAHGAKYRGQYVGTFGDIGVFSLNVNKTIQTGEGGVCITNNEDLRYRLALIRNHGEAVVEGAQYQDITNIVGFNYRLTEIQAAIAVEQLKKLDHLNKVRIAHVEYLSTELRNYDFFRPLTRCLHKNCVGCVNENGEICYPTFYVFPVRYIPEVGKPARRELVSALNAEGIRFSEGYVRPLYLQPTYQKKQAFKYGYPFTAAENRSIDTNYFRGACPNAEKLHFEQLIINEHIRHPHKFEDIKDIINAIEKVLLSC